MIEEFVKSLGEPFLVEERFQTYLRYHGIELNGNSDVRIKRWDDVSSMRVRLLLIDSQYLIYTLQNNLEKVWEITPEQATFSMLI